jgi:hypothetical protein
MFAIIYENCSKSFKAQFCFAAPVSVPKNILTTPFIAAGLKEPAEEIAGFYFWLF